MLVGALRVRTCLCTDQHDFDSIPFLVVRASTRLEERDAFSCCISALANHSVHGVTQTESPALHGNTGCRCGTGLLMRCSALHRERNPMFYQSPSEPIYIPSVFWGLAACGVAFTEVPLSSVFYRTPNMRFSFHPRARWIYRILSCLVIRFRRLERKRISSFGIQVASRPGHFSVATSHMLVRIVSAARSRDTNWRPVVSEDRWKHQTLQSRFSELVTVITSDVP